MDKYKFPKIWAGYLFALSFILIELVSLTAKDPGTRDLYTLAMVLVGIIGFVYWCVCVYKLHKTLLELTSDHYPVSPAAAAGFMLVPFYNLYWMFKWPGEIINLINTRTGSQKYRPWVAGLYLLLAMLIGRAIDGSLGLIGAFGVLSYLVSAIKKSLAVNSEPAPYKDSASKVSTGVIVALVCFGLIIFLGILAAIAIPSFIGKKTEAEKYMCIANMRNIKTAITAWSIDSGSQSDAIPAKTDLAPAYIKEWPKCKNVEYAVPSANQNPVCPNKIQGHKLE